MKQVEKVGINDGMCFKFQSNPHLNQALLWQAHRIMEMRREAELQASDEENKVKR